MLTDQEIADAVRPLYADARAAGMALPCDIATARAVLAAAKAKPAEPLTDEQIKDACSGISMAGQGHPLRYDRAIARAIEAAHGIAAITKEQP